MMQIATCYICSPSDHMVIYPTCVPQAFIHQIEKPLFIPDNVLLSWGLKKQTFFSSKWHQFNHHQALKFVSKINAPKFQRKPLKICFGRDGSLLTHL